MIFRTRSFVATVAITLFISSFVVVRHLKKQSRKASYTIGILQTASHPALDAVRDGFIEQLTKQAGSKVEFILKNAQGSVTSAHTIAEQMHNDKNIDAIFAIATPAAQAVAAVEKMKPIFVGAVTDPQALGLVGPESNVSGASDMLNIKAEIEMLTQLLPQVKTVALLFTNAEVNSVELVKQMHDELTAHGITAIDFAVSSESEMPMAAESAFSKADAVLSPTDNNVASTIEMINQLAQKYKKPFIASDNLLVKKGALAARGVDYKENGKQAAQIANAVLIEKQKPSSLPIAQQKNNRVYINKNVLDSLDLIIPDVLQENLVIVE
jgi:putative ABC transport system substrate-binding protein